MLATLSSKGQITIPVSIRMRLNLQTGDAVDFVVVSDDKVEIHPSRRPVTVLKGLVPKPRRPVSLQKMEEAIS